jgi:hypothetical protein
MVAVVFNGGVCWTLRVGVASCTLGVGMVSCTLGVGVSMFTLGVGGVADAGFAAGLKVTCGIVDSCVGVGCYMGILFINLSIFCNASYSIVPFVFRCSLSAYVRSFNAFTIASSGVSVGAMMCLCLKCTVSDILTPLVCFTYISWHL